MQIRHVRFRPVAPDIINTVLLSDLSLSLTQGGEVTSRSTARSRLEDKQMQRSRVKAETTLQTNNKERPQYYPSSLWRLCTLAILLLKWFSDEAGSRPLGFSEGTLRFTPCNIC
ncbi:hypothetical protein Baya_6711 [Bagarius yarrelli]|uniref:Uncharacterized protein n=1 Tax=Bagarius yarrelli TaxID=175774 RepID=A0A556U1M0_BAGYA|nr:hypothetical protein Baya_6711 [Bagarius yarrelli]